MAHFSRFGLIALGALALAAPVGANVRDGVEAWSRGDYAAAVAEWQAPAEAGDPDAMFNLGQAYRLGRGVPLDPARAEALYARAAAGGHVQAGDTYGLMLFQDGRRAQALPYVEGAARRGDPRAQYLLGVAHYNGDLVARDWPRAYALLTLANSAGLPQAAPAIAEMDQYMPLDQRQQGAALARQLESEALAAREVELASADFGNTAAPAPGAPTASPRVPRPIATTGVSPSIAAARDAVAQARAATGTESPADAGASYADRPQVAAAPPAPRPTARPAPTPAPRPAATSAPRATPAPAAANGPWRVQLGAFGVRGNAEALWTRVARRPELAGHERLLVPAGRVTRLLAGGFATQADAQVACRALQTSGYDCLVTRN